MQLSGSSASQAHPRIDIKASLSGTPSSSAFARVFQFGMRHGMRAYTMGQAWWVGDCGPYWGHNALSVSRRSPRIAICRFCRASCRSAAMLSHDQVEAH
jgi:membrane glycosyltransferase